VGKRVLITTFSSFGDLNPYLGLALGLKARGHDPLIATAEFYRPFVEGEGVGFFRAGDPASLADFDPLAPARVAGYARLPREVLLSGLHDAQLTLHAAVAAVTPADLSRAGRRDCSEPVTVAGLLRFLPAHQADHAAQLEALTGGTGRP
jgi:hypothetical protein